MAGTAFASKEKENLMGFHQHQGKEAYVLLKDKWTFGKKPAWVSSKEILPKMTALKCRATIPGKSVQSGPVERGMRDGGSS